MEDVRTLLRDSGLGHSYWAEAAAYSIDTRNFIPSQRHPDKVPLESFSGKRQGVAHLRVFGAKCWAKIPRVNGVQVTGGSKLDPRSVECRLLGYASGHGNYKVQDWSTRRIYISRDVVFEEGQPHRTSASVGEQIQLFDTLINDTPAALDPNPEISKDNHISDPDRRRPGHHTPDLEPENLNIVHVPTIHDEPRRSTRIIQPSQAVLQSSEYREREIAVKGEGEDWATNRRNPRADSAIDSTVDRENMIACLSKTRASHNIPHSYKHAMATDPDRWMIPMKTEIETLKSKHTWDLVRSPPGANIMGSMWVYDIKWDGEGKRIKDKARLVAKGSYTQQLGVDYNETWAGVTRLESVRMTAAVAARLNLKSGGSTLSARTSIASPRKTYTCSSLKALSNPDSRTT